MDEIRLVDVRESILSDNKDEAEVIRRNLAQEDVYMLNLMASPGAGKTSVIIQTLRRLKEKLRMAVIDGDVESMVDTEKIQAEGFPAVQIRTGGACHLDAPMVSAALEHLNLGMLDLVFIENIGNLICPASFDTGADLSVMILSVPEGDDKVLKYPIMFTIADVLLVNKMDYLDEGFDLEMLHRRARELNPRLEIFGISCKTGAGLDAWSSWLLERVQVKTRQT